MLGKLRAGFKFCVDGVVYDARTQTSTLYEKIPFVLHIPGTNNECKTGFQVVELMAAFLICDGIPGMLGDNKELLCACCGELPARAAVAWYPFDISKWDGNSLPIVIKDKDEHSTCPIRLMAWCGETVKCKVDMYDELMEELVPSVKEYNFTGGKRYCMICGSTDNILRDFHTGVTYCEQCTAHKDFPVPQNVSKYIKEINNTK